jgi:hypothetical protein
MRWIGGVLALAACTSNSTLDFEDHGILLPTLRIELPKRATGPTGAPEAESAGPAPSRGRFGLCSELTYGSGSFASGSGDYELFSWQLFAYLGTDPAPEQPFAARLLFGTEYLHLDVDGAGSSGATRDDGGSFGLAVGVETDFRCFPGGAVYARGTAGLLAPDTATARLETGLRVQPFDALELFAGYRWWRVRREDVLDVFGSGLDIDMHTDGIVVGFGLVF